MSESGPIPRAPRISIGLEAEVRILFPEDTFTPYIVSGRTMDLSLTGVRVVSHAVTHDSYRRVMHTIRDAKVILTVPSTNEELTLRGRIVWVHYDNKQGIPECAFGIAFSPLGDNEMQILRRLITDYVNQAFAQ
jgi:hypothetical protein